MYFGAYTLSTYYVSGSVLEGGYNQGLWRQRPALEPWPQYDNDHEHVLEMTREGSSSPGHSFGNSKVGKGLSLIVDGKLKYKETKTFSEIARIQTNLVRPVTLITILPGYRLSSVRASL